MAGEAPGRWVFDQEIRLHQGLRVLVCPCGIDVSSSALRFLTALSREHRRRLGTRWRRLSASTYRYVAEAVEVSAALAPTLTEAVRTASSKAFVLLDGTLLPVDRVAADRPFYSDRHKKHGMNVQVIAGAFGRLLWASPALPGAVHDIRAAREHGIAAALTEARIDCWADKAYQGAKGTVRVPHRGRREKQSEGQKAVNRSPVKPGKRRQRADALRVLSSCAHGSRPSLTVCDLSTVRRHGHVCRQPRPCRWPCHQASSSLHRPPTRSAHHGPHRHRAGSNAAHRADARNNHAHQRGFIRGS